MSKKSSDRWDRGEDIPLSEIIAWVDDAKLLPGGCVCPACGQHAERYKREITWRLIDDMIRLIEAGGDKDFVKVTNKLINGHDLAKLRYWNFVMPGKKSSTWMVTQRGIHFLKGYIDVPKKAYTYNKQFLGYVDTNDRITVKYVMGDNFVYEEPKDE